MGTTQEVLVDGVNPKDSNQVMGRTEHNKIAFFDGSIEEMKGQLVKVKVNAATASCLYCDVA